MISGFTLVRNGVLFDYPFRESIRSLLPLVDELIVNVGKGDDDTLGEVRKLQSEPYGNKIQIFESHWPLDDPEKKKSGLILSEQTNLALERCRGDWCIYLQADEVLHEDDAHLLNAALVEREGKTDVDALVFDYVHFYGSYDIYQHSRSTYRREVRAIRKASGAKSVGDAQSFRLADGSKPRSVLAGARVFHYGWVRTPEAMKEKTFFMDQLYHGDPTAEANATRTPHTGDNYRYKRIWGLYRFRGKHPAVMKERIRSKNWNWEIERSPLIWSWRDSKRVTLDLIEKFTGRRLFEYRSYRLVNSRSPRAQTR